MVIVVVVVTKQVPDEVGHALDAVGFHGKQTRHGKDVATGERCPKGGFLADGTGSQVAGWTFHKAGGGRSMRAASLQPPRSVSVAVSAPVVVLLTVPPAPHLALRDEKTSRKKQLAHTGLPRDHDKITFILENYPFIVHQELLIFRENNFSFN